jgi:hypothetical protein
MNNEKNEKKVYFIGAGFSHGFTDEFPLMGEIFPDSGRAREILSYNEMMNIEDNLCHHLNYDIKKLDIEDALAYCDLVQQGQMIFGRGIDNKLIAMQLTNLLKKCLNQRLQVNIEIPENDNYLEFIKLISENDYIITYNYDLLLEKLIIHEKSRCSNIYYNLESEITEIRKACEPFRPLQNGYLLKLHGSLNWYVCSNSACPNHNTIVIRNEEDEEKDNQFVFCRNCSSDLEQVIIYPGISKRYERFPKIGHLWKMAQNALSVATKIVVIGYSFRPQDIATTFILRNNQKFVEPGTMEWIIVDPNYEEIKKRLENLLPVCKKEINESLIFENIEDFVKKYQA